VKVVLAAVAAVAVLLVVFFVIARSVTKTDGPDCSGFTLAPGQWQATSADDRSDLQLKIAGCRALAGKSPAEVQSLLGAPTKGDPATEVSYAFGPSDPRSMYVRFDGGKVVQVGRNGPPVAS
jgi:hypothetical protein